MPECSIPDCQRPARGKGYCKPHHLRWWRHGDPLAGRGTVAPTIETTPCAVDGCARSADAKGFCSAHYQRWLANGDAGVAELEEERPGAVCEMDGCERRHYAKGLCQRHWQRLYKNGDPTIVLTTSRGDDIGYGAAHERVKRLKGSASQHLCISCGVPAKDWAYDQTCPNEKWGPPHTAEPGRLLAYSTDPERYVPMCRKCHNALDAAYRKLRQAS